MAWTNRRCFPCRARRKDMATKRARTVPKGESTGMGGAWGACQPFRGVGVRRAARSRFPVLNRTQSPAKRVCVREKEGADGYAAFPVRHSRGSGMESASSDEGVESSAGKPMNPRGPRFPPTGFAWPRLSLRDTPRGTQPFGSARQMVLRAGVEPPRVVNQPRARPAQRIGGESPLARGQSWMTR